MRGITINRPYTLLAEHYDQLFHDYQPVGEAARERLLGKVFTLISSACDLGCGTGTTALALARKGLSVFAVDLSPTMCDLARQKARRARLPVTVLNADMLRFRLPEPVDLVTCEFDAINHVPRKSDLAPVAHAVARALRPGGYFYFDVNNRLSFEKVWQGTWWTEKPGVVVVMHGGYDRSRATAFSDVELFIREGRCWRRFRERIEEVCWTPNEIRRTLGQAGFEKIRAWDAARFFKGNPMIRPGYRSFYLARRSPVKPADRARHTPAPSRGSGVRPG